MALTKYDLVNTTGLKGISFGGEFIPLDKIDDTLAEQLVGKTHILKEKSPRNVAKAIAAAATPAE